MGGGEMGKSKGRLSCAISPEKSCFRHRVNSAAHQLPALLRMGARGYRVSLAGATHSNHNTEHLDAHTFPLHRHRHHRTCLVPLSIQASQTSRCFHYNHPHQNTFPTPCHQPILHPVLVSSTPASSPSPSRQQTHYCSPQPSDYSTAASSLHHHALSQSVPHPLLLGLRLPTIVLVPPNVALSNPTNATPLPSAAPHPTLLVTREAPAASLQPPPPPSCSRTQPPTHHRALARDLKVGV